jgi:AcrR family transcriptional regulator
MPTARRAREARREEVLSLLADALEQLIRDGERFTDISVERLAAAAGMSRTSFYRHFHDKNELLSEWLLSRHGALAETAQGIWRLGPEATPAKLAEIEREVHEDYRPHVAVMTAFYDAAAADPGLRAEYDEIMDARTERLRVHIERGQAEGWLDPTVPPEETAAWLVCMAEWGNHQLALEAGADPPAGSLADFFWRVLYAPCQPAAHGGES